VIPLPGTRASLAGDVNDDGYNDLITGNPLPWGGFIHIYLGGPDVDSIPDIVIRNSEFEGVQELFGNDVSGIGDFNGDGIDDFAFSAIGTNSRGAVYIMSGWSEATSAVYDYEPTLPDGYRLSHNFPNPFNPETTIEFQVPARSQVTLRIYNVLGQEITTLINDDLSAGTYTVKWDGRDNQGHDVASGVYIYKLSSDTYTQSRKMLLLK